MKLITRILTSALSFFYMAILAFVLFGIANLAQTKLFATALVFTIIGDLVLLGSIFCYGYMQRLTGAPLAIGVITASFFYVLLNFIVTMITYPWIGNLYYLLIELLLLFFYCLIIVTIGLVGKANNNHFRRK